MKKKNANERTNGSQKENKEYERKNMVMAHLIFGIRSYIVYGNFMCVENEKGTKKLSVVST